MRVRGFPSLELCTGSVSLLTNDFCATAGPSFVGKAVGVVMPLISGVAFNVGKVAVPSYNR